MTDAEVDALLVKIMAAPAGQNLLQLQHQSAMALAVIVGVIFAMCWAIVWSRLP